MIQYSWTFSRVVIFQHFQLGNLMFRSLRRSEEEQRQLKVEVIQKPYRMRGQWRTKSVQKWYHVFIHFGHQRWTHNSKNNCGLAARARVIDVIHMVTCRRWWSTLPGWMLPLRHLDWTWISPKFIYEIWEHSGFTWNKYEPYSVFVDHCYRFRKWISSVNVSSNLLARCYKMTYKVSCFIIAFSFLAGTKHWVGHWLSLTDHQRFICRESLGCNQPRSDKAEDQLEKRESIEHQNQLAFWAPKAWGISNWNNQTCSHPTCSRLQGKWP